MMRFLRSRRLPSINLLVGFLLSGLWIASCCDRKEELTYKPTPFKPAIPFYLEYYYKEPADNPTTKEGIALGKSLFSEKALSIDYTISCATCHNEKKGFADGLKVSKGVNGVLARRNAPGLTNTAFQTRFFWDGRDTSLEEQSLHPIQDPIEMGLTLNEAIARLQSNRQYPDLFFKAFGSKTVTADRIAKALAQFQRSLVSFNTKYDRFLIDQYTPTPEEKLGMDLFFQHPDPFAGLKGIRGGNCGDCHLQRTLMGRQDGFFGFHNTGLTTSGSADKGLQQITGLASDFGKFKAPPLRNVALTAPYMHDGRFNTLEEVLDHYNAEDLFTRPNVDGLITLGTNQKFGQSLMLTEPEKKAIISFLHMLTDTTLVQKP